MHVSDYVLDAKVNSKSQDAMQELHIAVSCSAVKVFLLLLLGKLTKEVVYSLRMMLQEVEVVSFYV